jgi:hypothetical protein
MNLSPPWMSGMMLGIFIVGGLAGYATHWWIVRRERSRWLREQGWQ